MPPLWILTLIAACVASYILFVLKDLVVLLVVAFAVAYTVEPILRKLEARNIRRPLGVVVIVVLVVAVISVMVLAAIPTVTREFARLSGELPSFVGKASEVLRPLIAKIPGNLPSDLGAIEKLSIDYLQQSPEQVAQVLGGSLKKVVAAVSSALLSGYSITLTLLNLTLLPFLVYYIAIDFPRIQPTFVGFFPILRRQHVETILSQIDDYVASFVRGQFLVGASMAGIYAIALWWLGIELWFLLALVAGFGNLVPYLGTLLGVVLGTLMALVTFGDINHVLWLWGIFALVQFIEGSFLTPKIIGDSVGLSPLIVILSIVVGGSLFGLLGIFLAIPGAAVVRVLLGHSHKWMLSRV